MEDVGFKSGMKTGESDGWRLGWG